MIDKTHQSAVDWLFTQLYEKFEMKGDGIEMNKIVEQAKSMEKKEISTAYECGWIYGDLKKAPNKGEDYFNIINNIDIDEPLKSMSKREEVAQYNPDAILWDDLDDAIIGMTTNGQVVYSTHKIHEILMKTSDMTLDDAIDYAEYNIFGGYVGEFTPIHISEF
jgi:hypothetical protein